MPRARTLTTKWNSIRGVFDKSKTFNQDMLEKYEVPASITTLVLFIPFSGIEYIISSVECVALSETALGLRH